MQKTDQLVYNFINKKDLTWSYALHEVPNDSCHIHCQKKAPSRSKNAELIQKKFYYTRKNFYKKSIENHFYKNQFTSSKNWAEWGKTAEYGYLYAAFCLKITLQIKNVIQWSKRMDKKTSLDQKKAVFFSLCTIFFRKFFFSFAFRSKRRLNEYDFLKKNLKNVAGRNPEATRCVEASQNSS